WPNTQSTLVGADPGTEFDTVCREKAALKVAVVRDVVVGTPEAIDDLGQGGCLLHVFIDDVMHGRGARRDRLARIHQSIHGIGDATAADQVDAGDLNDGIAGRIGAGGFDVDDAYQASQPWWKPHSTAAWEAPTLASSGPCPMLRRTALV